MNAGDFVQLSDVQMDLYCQFRDMEMSAGGDDFVENAARAVEMNVTTIRTFLSLSVTNFSWNTKKKNVAK